jgi:hypothetical protein
MRAAGLRAGLATLGKPPTHVAVAVELGGKWLWAEPTVRGAQLGEHPRAAIRRTLAERPDLGELTAAEEQELRAQIVEFGALGLAAVAARAIWDRKYPTATDVVVAVSTAAWTPVLLLAVRQLWQKWSATDGA